MDQLMNIVSLSWPFVLLIAIFYFFVYRPQKKAQLKRGRFLLSLKKGDHVVTAGGVHGTIKVLRDKYVELEVAPKIVLKVEKSAIHHGDVELIDEQTAVEKGAQEVGEAAELEENNLDPVKKGKKKEESKAAKEESTAKADKDGRDDKDDKDVKVITEEKVVEVDDPKDAGVEVVDEVVNDPDDGEEQKDQKDQKTDAGNDKKN